MVLRHRAAAVCFHETYQVFHLCLQIDAFVCLSNLPAFFQSLEDSIVIINVMVSFQSLFPNGKGLVGNHTKIPGAEQQGVTGNTRGLLISPAEAAVDDQQLTAALDGTFTLLCFHGNMTVNDVAVLPFQTEFLQKHIADCWIVVIGIVGISYLNIPDVKSDNTILWLYTAIRFAVVFQWHEHNFEASVEEIAVKYERLLREPLIQDIF